MDFCQKQVSGIHFDLPGIKIMNPPKSICYGSFYQKKCYPHLSQILTIRTPYTMYIDAKSARFRKYFPTDIIYTSHQALLFNQVELLWLLACHL